MAVRLAPPPELMDSRDIVEADLPAALTLFKSLQEQGLSFLEVKDHLLLLYIQDLSHLMLEKTSGRSVLEKMRPIEQKLKYQVDKLVKAVVTGGLDETEMEKEKKMAEQAKKRALSSSIIRELKEQYSDAPEEIREGRHAHTARQNREDEHRTNYEESMMVRLNVTRKEKARRRRGGVFSSQLGSLTHFRDISALTGATPSLGEDLNPPKKRRKKIGAKGGKRKGFRKRR
ncbi:hypothetical protein E2320_022753 [Naja naja]|nr:hypothetical protein E2320_022753 [Naja naja]